MAEARVERRLAAILAADIVGYSRLMGADEVGTLAALKTHRREIVDPTIATHHGRIVKTTGDGMLVEFASAVDAVTCAVVVQEKMAERTAEGTGPRIQFRVGINIGDIIIDGDDIFGDGVNLAARVENECEPGGVYLSDDAYRQVRGKTSFIFDDLGEKSLKNIDQSVRLYAVRSAAFSTEASAKAPAEANKPLPLPDKPSIAVLPFQNMSSDPEQEYFADGMVEEIITALSQFKWLFVIARNSSFTYKGKAVDIKQVGRELGVRYVLEGSVRKASGKVRITGQLIDAVTGAHIWADRIEGGLEDVFELQDCVTASVVGAIAPPLEHAEIERAKRKPTENLDAYDYYLRGMASLYRWTKEDVTEALRLFYKAIELDPEFASAYGMGAWCYHWRRVNGWTADLGQEIAEVTRLAGRAAELGKEDAVALSYGGLALGHASGEVEAGAAMVDRALALNPNLAAASYANGVLSMLAGDREAAIKHLERAMRLSPLDPLTFFMLSYAAIAHFLAGRYDEAWPLAERACREQQNFMFSLRIAAASNAFAGRLGEARRWIGRALQLDPNLRISNLKDRIGPMRPEDFAKYVDALRKAGLPE